MTGKHAQSIAKFWLNLVIQSQYIVSSFGTDISSWIISELFNSLVSLKSYEGLTINELLTQFMARRPFNSHSMSAPLTLSSRPVADVTDTTSIFLSIWYKPALRSRRDTCVGDKGFLLPTFQFNYGTPQGSYLEHVLFSSCLPSLPWWRPMRVQCLISPFHCRWYTVCVSYKHGDYARTTAFHKCLLFGVLNRMLDVAKPGLITSN